MRLIDIVRRAGRSLRQSKMRTLLTSLAIGVGAFTITLSLAAGAGGKDYAETIVNSNINKKQILVTKQSKQSDGPAEYSEDGASSMTTVGTGSVDTLNDNDVKTIQTVPGVASANPTLGTTPLYITRPDYDKKYQLSTIDVYDSAIDLTFVAGQHVDTLDDQGTIISDEYRKALGFASASDAIGKTVQIALVKGGVQSFGVTPKLFDYTVRGVVEKSSVAAQATASVLVSQQSLRAMHDYQYAGTQYASNYAAVYAVADSEADVDAVKQALTDKGYQAQSAEDIMQFIFQFINVLQGILLGFGALAVLTAVFGIINTQYISVLERTSQIGLMKALGMSRRDVGRLFKIEAAWIGFLGGAIGAGLALLAGTVANPYITKALNLEDGMSLLIFQPWTFAVVIGGLMIIAVLAGILPARKASKLDPIEALRTE